jgi:Cu/Ag efflux protein CusF
LSGFKLLLESAEMAARVTSWVPLAIQMVVDAGRSSLGHGQPDLRPTLICMQQQTVGSAGFRNTLTGKISMRKLTIISAAVLSIAMVPAFGQTGGAAVMKSAPGKATVAEAVRVTASVEAVDKEKRLVTLKGPEGNSFVVQAGPEVKNFDQIKAGDVVVASYVEALTLELKKGGGAMRERTERESSAAAKPGERPGAAEGRRVTVIADVIAVDAKKQSVRLRGPQRTVDLKVKDPEQFKLIKVGDQVEATFTEAVALSVEPAPKPAAKK